MYVYLFVYRLTEQLISVSKIWKYIVRIECNHNNYCCAQETKLFLYKGILKKELLHKQLSYIFLPLPSLDSMANEIKVLQIIFVSCTSINLQRTLLLYSINVQDNNGSIKGPGEYQHIWTSLSSVQKL
jgi:hypothetical protein